MLFACSDSVKQQEREFLKLQIEQMENLGNYEWVVILPGVGCNGCIQGGEYFMKMNVCRKDILYILTQISSLKILRQKLGLDLGKYSNILIDREKLFRIPTGNSIYPCVVKLGENTIEEHWFHSPECNAFGFIPVK